jgi:hypothetical protein
MNRRVWCCPIWSPLGLLSVIGLFGGVCHAQPAPAAAAVPEAIRNAENLPNAASAQPTIHAFITKEFTDLQVTDGTGPGKIRSDARDLLIKACPKTATPSYLGIYSQEVNTAAQAVFAAKKPLVVRLIVAIVVNSVAANGQTLDTIPAVIDILGDRDISVASWGVKASRPLIALLVQSPQFAGNKLVPAVIACVKQYAGDPSEDAGFLIEDAYAAMTIADVAGATPAQKAQLAVPLIDPVLELLKIRIELHAKQLVPIPSAESAATLFLSDNAVSMTKDQKERTIAALVTLMTEVGQRASDYQAEQDAHPLISSKKELMASVRSCLRRTAGALVVITDHEPALQQVLLWFQTLNQTAGAGEILQHTTQIFPTAQITHPTMNAVPPVAPITAPAGPATAPAVPAGAPAAA